MKKRIYILPVFLFLLVGCTYRNGTNDEPLPVKIDLYYEYNTAPWRLMKFIDTTPKEFLNHTDIKRITLVDSASQIYFRNLKRKLELAELSHFPFDTWFSAIVDYGTYQDTVSVNNLQLKYNDKIIKDTLAIFYYMDAICARDTMTCMRFNDF